MISWWCLTILPSYDGGYDKMLADIRQRIRYPESAKACTSKGGLIVAVDLDEQGRLISSVCYKAPTKLFDDDALRVVGTIQKLHPAMKNGKL
jgi:outer membrane biosynthesis protein TonB